eukprot:9165483-Pyramimonas_sp.AAC.1
MPLGRTAAPERVRAVKCRRALSVFLLSSSSWRPLVVVVLLLLAAPRRRRPPRRPRRPPPRRPRPLRADFEAEEEASLFLFGGASSSTAPRAEENFARRGRAREAPRTSE